MSVEKRIDKNHPDFPEYLRKYKALWDQYYAFEKAEKAKYPNYRGLDHPARAVTVPAYRKCCADSKKLQEEYAYLFTEPIHRED